MRAVKAFTAEGRQERLDVRAREFDVELRACHQSASHAYDRHHCRDRHRVGAVRRCPPVMSGRLTRSLLFATYLARIYKPTKVCQR